MSDPDRFHFNLDDEEPEEPLQDEALRQRVNKLSQRMSFVTLLLPCLLAIVIYVVYRDIGLRLTQTQSSEQHSAETLAVQLEQKFSALLARVDTLEAGLNNRMDALPKNLTALPEEIRKLETALAAVKAEKTDKKEIGESLARVDSAISALAKDMQAVAPFREELGSASALRQELSSVSARLLKLENSLGKDLTGLAGYIDKSKAELTQIKSDLARLSSQKLDREAIDLEILKSKKIYQMALDQEVARIDKAVSAILRRLDQVEKAFSGAPVRGGTGPAPSGTIREQPVD